MLCADNGIGCYLISKIADHDERLRRLRGWSGEHLLSIAVATALVRCDYAIRSLTPAIISSHTGTISINPSQNR